jgi:molecular chaperone DnaK
MTITGGSGIAKEEIDRMVQEAQKHADEDKKRRELTDAQNQGESLVYQTEKLLADNKDKLDDAIAQPIKDDIAALKQAISGDNLQTIRDAQSKLLQSSQKIGEQVYQNTSANASSDSSSTESESTTSGADDETVEAEIVDEDNPDGDAK